MIKACLGNKLESFGKSPIVLFVVLNTLFRCSSNVNLMSKITPRCPFELTTETLLMLKNKGGCASFFNFLLNIISWACLLRSRLKVVFHRKTESLIFFRSLLNSIADVFISCTTKNREESSANNLAFDNKPFDKSFMIDFKK